MSDDTQEATLTWQVTPDMLCILDQEGRFYAVNPAWTATLGWQRQELLGQAYVTFLHPDDVARSEIAFERVKRGVPVLRFENRYREKSGGYRWFSWVAVPESGKFYCTVRDVTEAKENIETIEKQRSEAELREQFLAVLGHDLRNPLAAFSAGTNILRRQNRDSASADLLEQMQSSTRRMSEMIDNLMDLARVRLGDGISLDRQRHDAFWEDLNEIVEEIRLAHPGVTIRIDFAVDGPVICDLARTRQVISNLLANAVSHGTAGEPIDVRAHREEGWVRISVENKGEPIPEAVRRTLFQPFFRGDVRESSQGLGLGLYIAAEIVSAHGGSLEVNSSEALTEFAVLLPG